MQFSEKVMALAAEAETALKGHFDRIDKTAFDNTQKVINTFREYRVSDSMFVASSGYGYDDKGRDTLDMIWADVMGAEKAFVRNNIVNGTHALTIGLSALLRPGDIMLSVTGKPYDTLEEVIGIRDNSVICDRHVVEKLKGIAEENNIKYQLEILERGGTDTGAMQRSGHGARVGAVSVPTRYIHTAVECVDMGDVNACVKLISLAAQTRFD